jgi:thiaminase/transcriptional activator TenA
MARFIIFFNFGRKPQNLNNSGHMTNKKPLPYGPFAQKLWDSATDIIDEIMAHPFCLGLAKGDLPMAAFRHYLGQDMLYIIEDARALALTGTRAEDVDQMYFFLAMAKDGLEIERLLHAEFGNYFHIPRAPAPSAACLQYTDYLLNKARNDHYEVSVSALLPCFWVYQEISHHILEQSVTNNPYQKWLDTYSDKSFEVFVNQFIEIASHLMERASEGLQQKMTEAFRASTHYEYLFFDEAWKRGNSLS